MCHRSEEAHARDRGRMMRIVAPHVNADKAMAYLVRCGDPSGCMRPHGLLRSHVLWRSHGWLRRPNGLLRSYAPRRSQMWRSHGHWRCHGPRRSHGLHGSHGLRPVSVIILQIIIGDGLWRAASIAVDRARGGVGARATAVVRQTLLHSSSADAHQHDHMTCVGWWQAQHGDA